MISQDDVIAEYGDGTPITRGEVAKLFDQAAVAARNTGTAAYFLARAVHIRDGEEFSGLIEAMTHARDVVNEADR